MGHIGGKLAALAVGVLQGIGHLVEAAGQIGHFAHQPRLHAHLEVAGGHRVGCRVKLAQGVLMRLEKKAARAISMAARTTPAPRMPRASVPAPCWSPGAPR